MCVCVCVCAHACMRAHILGVTKCAFDQILNWQIVKSVFIQSQDKAEYYNHRMKFEESVLKWFFVLQEGHKDVPPGCLVHREPDCPDATSSLGRTQHYQRHSLSWAHKYLLRK